VRKYLRENAVLNCGFEIAKEGLIWGEDEEKLFAFRKSNYLRFSFVPNAERNPSELNLCAAKRKAYFDVEAAA